MTRLSWLDSACTGEIRRPLLSAAIASLRFRGMPFDARGLVALGIEEGEAILDGIVETMPETWASGVSTDPAYLAAEGRLRAVVEAHLKDRWWDASRRIADGLGIATYLAPSAGEGAWDRYIRSEVLAGTCGTHEGEEDGWAWKPTPSPKLREYDFGLPVTVTSAPTGSARTFWLVCDDRMHAVLTSWREHARRQGNAARYPTPALLMDEDRREAVFAAYMVGGTAAGAQALAACFR